jgi:phosphoenolpyruvate synthase/pyruvate phosphate dikinase
MPRVRDEDGEKLLRITRAFAPRPVIYRTYDFRTNEFRGLAGGEQPSSRARRTR